MTFLEPRGPSLTVEPEPSLLGDRDEHHHHGHDQDPHWH